MKLISKSQFDPILISNTLSRLPKKQVHLRCIPGKCLINTLNDYTGLLAIYGEVFKRFDRICMAANREERRRDCRIGF